jgi:hypothetical protein
LVPPFYDYTLRITSVILRAARRTTNVNPLKIKKGFPCARGGLDARSMGFPLRGSWHGEAVTDEVDIAARRVLSTSSVIRLA